MPTPYPKEQMHRFKHTRLTPEQIAGRLASVTAPMSAPPLSAALAGRTFTIVLDGGPALTSRFIDRGRRSPRRVYAVRDATRSIETVSFTPLEQQCQERCASSS